MKEVLTEKKGLAGQSAFITLVSLSLVVAILYVAKVVIMPVAVAIMLTFLLAPLVIRLQRLGFPRVVAIISTVIIAFSIIAAVAWTLSSQIISLAEQLPRYEQTLRNKIRDFNSSQQSSSPLSRAGDVVENLRKELNNEPPQDSEESGANSSKKVPVEPVTVEIKPDEMNAIESVTEIFGPVVAPLGTTGLVAIFVIAILFQREDLRERFIRITSGGRLNVATEALDDAAKRVSRYLVMQLLVNATYGIPVGVGLYFIGVPNALLWGFLATLLRFIPYLGPWIAAAFPLALAFAIDPGWSTLLMALGLFLTLELISNNIIEPWLYGVSTGISNFALMVAAVFWTWLWGPVGLFLSTPLTVCVVVLGNYVPSLNFISVLLGSLPALKPHERLYQRMLAMDYDEVLLLSQNFIKTHSLIEYYDQALIPALNAAKTDWQNGDLAQIRHTFILQNTLELLEDLHFKDEPEVSTASTPPRIIIVPAKEDIDELAGQILLSALEHSGIDARVESAGSLATRYADAEAKKLPEVICISSVPPGAFLSARRLSRRFSADCAGVKCFMGVWSPDAQANELQSRLSASSNALVVTSMQETVTTLQELVSDPDEGQISDNPASENEDKRQQELI